MHEIAWRSFLFEPLEHLLAHFGIDPHPAVDAVVASALLLVFAFFAGRYFRRQEVVEPAAHVSFTFLAEFIVVKLLAFFNGIIHHGARPVFPLLAGLMLFILLNNLLGLLPGFAAPTDQYNVTLPLALMIFFTAHTIGLRKHGLGYGKKFMGPLLLLAPLMVPIEIISHLVRPLSLSMRLFGNMTGDHQVLTVFSSLLAVGLPVPFMALGVLVSVLQAVVFVLLAAVYIQDAQEAPH